MRQGLVGVDVGGTTVKALLLAQDGEVLAADRRQSTGDPDALVELIAEIAGELAETASTPPAAVGVVVPGIVDEAAGQALFSANLGWRDVPFRALLAGRFPVPVAFGHDVRAGGLAECRLGAARGHGDVLFLAIGTGIAAAIITGGRPLAGGGLAGEVGHLVVRPGGEPCGCGARGCLETVASASAIARRYAELTGHPSPDARTVVERMRAGDPAASGVWRDAVHALADVLTTIRGLLAPEVVVVGGGLAEAGDDLLGPLTEQLSGARPPWWPEQVGRDPTLVRARLGDRAGAVGAALMAGDALR